MKNLFTQLNITTTSEGENESLLSFFLNAVGANSDTKQEKTDITTTSEETDACLYASVPSAVGAKPASDDKVAGFTLIETIVAMTILLVSVSGIMNLIHQGSVANRMQADQITATYLAAEGIEFIRAHRDSYWLEGGGNNFHGWVLSSELQNCPSGSGDCQVDARIGVGAQPFEQCGSSCDMLNYNDASGKYGYQTGSGWETSRFNRSVQMQPSDNSGDGQADELLMTVIVSWLMPGGAENSVTLEQSIYDYRDTNNN